MACDRVGTDLIIDSAPRKKTVAKKLKPTTFSAAVSPSATKRRRPVILRAWKTNEEDNDGQKGSRRMRGK